MSKKFIMLVSFACKHTFLIILNKESLLHTVFMATFLRDVLEGHITSFVVGGRDYHLTKRSEQPTKNNEDEFKRQL